MIWDSFSGDWAEGLKQQKCALSEQERVKLVAHALSQKPQLKEDWSLDDIGRVVKLLGASARMIAVRAARIYLSLRRSHYALTVEYWCKLLNRESAPEVKRILLADVRRRAKDSVVHGLDDVDAVRPEDVITWLARKATRILSVVNTPSLRIYVSALDAPETLLRIESGNATVRLELGPRDHVLLGFPIPELPDAIARAMDQLCVTRFAVEPCGSSCQSPGAMVRTEAVTERAPSALQRAHRRLEEAREELEAKSLTFYVRDPWWPGEFRLVLMPGVEYPETMYGFNMPESAKQVIAVGECERFLSFLPAEWQDDELSLPHGDLELEKDRCQLFKRFAEREGIKSRARLLHYVGSEVHASLFVNFSERVSFSARLKELIRKLMRDMVDFLPGITNELQQVTPMSAAQVMRILKPVHQLASMGLEKDRVSLEDRLGLILDACLQALHIHPETGLGTIHLFEPETRTLRLAAHRGRIDDFEVARAHSVYKGQGVVSWVVLRRRPLLIDDLERSAFKPIYRQIRDGIRSEMAVPMLARIHDPWRADAPESHKVLGVINLESIEPRAFASESLRIIYHAAERAATTWRLYQQIVDNREQAALLETLFDKLWLKFVSNREKKGAFLKELAETASKSLNASICDIWRYNVNQHRFDAVGATDSEFEEFTGPRPDGWSEYIRRKKRPVWITNVRAEKDFDAFVWHSDLKSWKTLPLSIKTPRSVNPHLFARGVQCELGIPILARGQCVGVTWLKYGNAKMVPSTTSLDWAESLVKEAALVLYKQEERETAIPSVETMELVGKFAEKAAKVIARQLRFVG